MQASQRSFAARNPTTVKRWWPPIFFGTMLVTGHDLCIVRPAVAFDWFYSFSLSEQRSLEVSVLADEHVIRNPARKCVLL